MTDICAGCRKPIVDTKPLIYSPYNRRGVTTKTYKCHPTSKCTDMLPLSESDKALIDRAIQLASQQDDI